MNALSEIKTMERTANRTAARKASLPENVRVELMRRDVAECVRLSIAAGYSERRGMRVFSVDHDPEQMAIFAEIYRAELSA